MIECLGVLVLNRPDLLERMIASIDVPVERLCIVQNSADAEVSKVVQTIKNNPPPLVNAVYVAQPFRNMGVAPSWNLIIKSFPECNSWMIVNNDTCFLPGDMTKMFQLWQSCPNSVVGLPIGKYSAFIIGEQVVAKAGLFDENIWPIYWEDSDYDQRLARLGIPSVTIDSHATYSADGSWTIRSNDHYRTNNNQTQLMNQTYYDTKWLVGITAGPWGQSLDCVANWVYDPIRRKQQSQIWNNWESTANRSTK